ncbi:threonine dehydratase [Rugosimonospora africana]|uniref:threonine ammonia-lyase n=2 Tax=Rugosimonospora africana TaxID=556532 RepID=A0A8J3VSZ9_9ACTN|nr:threonine dehydratase [Rugosimonospora africana]
MIGVADVEAAARRIAGRVRRTPVLSVEGGAFDGVADPTWLKLEYLQHTGSFKARGAMNRLLSAAEAGNLGDGVVAASGGNAGLAVAYAAGILGVPAEVYVPLTAPEVKVRKLKALGAEVRQVGAEYAEANAAALERAAQTGALFCHAYDQPEICAGQGTLALEMLDQVDGLDTVILAVGGGGLLAGVAAALHCRARVVGAEPETIPTLHAALAAGQPVDVEVSGIAADALGARRLGDIAYRVAVDTGVRSVLVSDQEVVEARRLLWEQCRIVMEHGTATALAALVTGAYRPEPGERVGILICGANTNPADLAH